jgi:prepilin-type N-terminal cleavage/methylation domain-containing protein
MISTRSTTGRAAAARAAARAATQTMQGARTGCGPRARGRLRGARGFSLIELMVALAVLVLISVVAFEGFRRNEKTNQRKRFVSAVHGALTQARNYAIDEQTPVRVDIDATSLTLTAWNPVNETWELFERVGMTSAREALILDGDLVCIYGLGTGVQTPSQAQDVDPPTDCLGALQRLRFEPDGTFTDPDDAFSAVPNSGVTLWIGDRSIPGDVKYAMIQVFPGGLIRAFEEVSS